MNNNSTPFLKLFLIIILFMLGIIFIYLHPSNEEMVCNNNLECNVLHEFLGFIHYNSTIKLNSSSQIFASSNCRYFRDRMHTGTACTVHINITDKYSQEKKPFIYYYAGYNKQIGNNINIEDFIKSEKYNFDRYLKNPNIGFNLSPLSGDFFIEFIVIGFLSIMLLYYVCHFLGIIED